MENEKNEKWWSEENNGGNSGHLRRCQSTARTPNDWNADRSCQKFVKGGCGHIVLETWFHLSGNTVRFSVIGADFLIEINWKGCFKFSEARKFDILHTIEFDLVLP